MHASCHGNRSGEAFLKDPVKHLECAGIFFSFFSEHEREMRAWKRCAVDHCPSFHPFFFFFAAIVSVNDDVGKSAPFGSKLKVPFLLTVQHSWKSCNYTAHKPPFSLKPSFLHLLTLPISP